MGAQDELIERMMTERRRLTAVTDRLMTRLDEEVGTDGWSVRDLLAHYAAWQRHAIRRMGTLKAGGEIQPIEADDFNPLAMAISRMWSEDEVRWEFEAAFNDLVEVVRSAPEDACVDEGWAIRYADRTAGSHYPEHLPDLERLLDSE
jgi:hypothetical protein